MEKWIIVSITSLLLIGCGQDRQARTYRVPKKQRESRPETVTHQPNPAPQQSQNYTYELPAGWTEKPATGMRSAIFALDQESSVDFYLIILGNGDIDSNVNRWRAQVGLPPLTKEQISTETETLDVNGYSVNWSEQYGTETDNGIIAAIFDRDPEYWFFTAKGPVDELKKNRDAIRLFIESVKIGE